MQELHNRKSYASDRSSPPPKVDIRVKLIEISAHYETKIILVTQV